MTALLPSATWDLPPPHPEALLAAGNLILRWGGGVDGMQTPNWTTTGETETPGGVYLENTSEEPGTPMRKKGGGTWQGAGGRKARPHSSMGSLSRVEHGWVLVKCHGQKRPWGKQARTGGGPAAPGPKHRTGQTTTCRNLDCCPPHGLGPNLSAQLWGRVGKGQHWLRCGAGPRRRVWRAQPKCARKQHPSKPK